MRSALVFRSCEESLGRNQSWRCFFAQDCQGFLETPALFHEYLYDSANLGYDGAGSSAEAEDFRSRLEASFKAAAAATDSACAGGCSEQPDGVCHNTSTMQLEVLPTGAGRTAVREMGHEPRDSAGNGDGKEGLVASTKSVINWQMRHGEEELEIVCQLGQNCSASEPVSATGCSEQHSRQLQQQSEPNVFAPACQLHEMIDSVLFTTSHVGSLRFVDTLSCWFEGECSGMQVLDGHSGVRGSSECGFDPSAAVQLEAVMGVGLHT